MDSKKAAESKYARIMDLLSSPQSVLREIGQILDDAGIDYAVTGGIALDIYNYRRATEDVDIVLTKEGFKKLKAVLIGTYFNFRPGSTRNVFFNSPVGRIKVDLIIEGDNKSGFAMPDPRTIRNKIGGVWYVSLPLLVAIKLAGGFHKAREADWPDVVRLIRENTLGKDYFQSHDPKLNRKWRELWKKANRK